MGSFYTKKGTERELLRKENKGLFSDQEILWEEENDKGFYHVGCCFLLWGMERAHVTDYLADVD